MNKLLVSLVVVLSIAVGILCFLLLRDKPVKDVRFQMPSLGTIQSEIQNHPFIIVTNSQVKVIDVCESTPLEVKKGYVKKNDLSFVDVKIRWRADVCNVSIDSIRCEFDIELSDADGFVFGKGSFSDYQMELAQGKTQGVFVDVFVPYNCVNNISRCDVIPKVFISQQQMMTQEPQRRTQEEIKRVDRVKAQLEQQNELEKKEEARKKKALEQQNELEKWDKVTKGMSPDSVESLLGKPNEVTEIGKKGKSGYYHEIWRYPDLGSVEFDNEGLKSWSKPTYSPH